jgi:AcrR family transcriptional regulator
MNEQSDDKIVKSPKREAIIKHAYDVFGRDGFHATAIDRVLADTGISKRTLYKYFRTKEELIYAVLEYYQSIIFQDVLKELSRRSVNPIDQILSLFDIKIEQFQEHNFLGCFAINARIEFEGKDPEIQRLCNYFYRSVEKCFSNLCHESGKENPEQLARHIAIIFKGGVLTAQMHHDANAMIEAKGLVQYLLQSS